MAWKMREFSPCPCVRGDRQLLFLTQGLQLWTVGNSLVTCLTGPIRKYDVPIQG